MPAGVAAAVEVRGLPVVGVADEAGLAVFAAAPAFGLPGTDGSAADPFGFRRRSPGHGVTRFWVFHQTVRVP